MASEQYKVHGPAYEDIYNRHINPLLNFFLESDMVIIEGWVPIKSFQGFFLEYEDSAASPTIKSVVGIARHPSGYFKFRGEYNILTQVGEFSFSRVKG